MALEANQFRRGGFFVEFGATDGKTLSNTFLLESHFGWSGILAEPARMWHPALKQNRSARIETRCVWNRSGERLDFCESAELSGITSLNARRGQQSDLSYQVETISLNDLLREHQAPSVIHFMSVDTEGSEFDILSAFDFSAWDVRCLAIEHNYDEAKRQQLFELLSPQGYSRLFPELSLFDDWYVKATTLPA